MKKWLTLTLLLFCIPALVWGWGTVVISGGVSGGGCNSSVLSVTGTTTGTAKLGQYGSNLWLATKFVANKTTTICKVKLRLYSVGDPTSNLTVYIYDHDAVEDDPGTLVGSGSDTVDASSIGTSEEDVYFQNIFASVISGVTYWVVVKSSSNDSSNYIVWTLADTTTERVMKDDDGLGTWTLQNANYSGKFELYE